MVPVTVLAATTAVVTVTNTPYFSQGISSFTITYVSDTEMDLNWTVDDTAANVMIRAKYGSYPTDIPNENTAPSDGYLVYYGTDLSVADTSMNFNENAGSIYYKAWAQKADGTWYVPTHTSSKESREVVLIGLIGLGVIGSIFAIMKRNVLFAIGAGALWFFLITYTRVNPLPNIVAGSGADSIFIGVCIAFSVATLLSVFWLNNRDEKRENPSPDEHEVNRHNARGSAPESAEEYQARLYSLTHPKKK